MKRFSVRKRDHNDSAQENAARQSGRAGKIESTKTMFTITREEIDWGGRKLTLETGRVARQADGAVLATYGETVVLCAVTAAKSVK